MSCQFPGQFGNSLRTAPFGNEDGRRPERHLLSQHQHQGLEQKREPRQLAGPVKLDQPNNRSVGQLDARHTHFQVALVLEENEMSIALGDGVMDRVC